jgi:hypothetical protein
MAGVGISVRQFFPCEEIRQFEQMFYVAFMVTVKSKDTIIKT